MTTLVRPFLFAWHFLTAVPLSRHHHEPTAMELASSMAWYSTVGLLIGGTLVLADGVLTKLFTSEVVNVLLIVLLIAFTRGLHQDGLADTLDGIAGGRTPFDRLSIMRDPRIGAIGATGLFFVVDPPLCSAHGLATSPSCVGSCLHAGAWPLGDGHPGLVVSLCKNRGRLGSAVSRSFVLPSRAGIDIGTCRGAHSGGWRLRCSRDIGWWQRRDRCGSSWLSNLVRRDYGGYIRGDE